MQPPSRRFMSGVAAALLAVASCAGGEGGSSATDARQNTSEDEPRGGRDGRDFPSSNSTPESPVQPSHTTAADDLSASTASGGDDGSTRLPICAEPEGYQCWSKDAVETWWGSAPFPENRGAASRATVYLVEPGIEPISAARATEGDSFVVVYLAEESVAARSIDQLLGSPSPIAQHTIVTDGGAFYAAPEDADESDGATRRWVQSDGRRMGLFETSDTMTLQWITEIPGGASEAVYSEVTFAPQHFSQEAAVEFALSIG